MMLKLSNLILTSNKWLMDQIIFFLFDINHKVFKNYVYVYEKLVNNYYVYVDIYILILMNTSSNKKKIENLCVINIVFYIF